MSEIWKDCLIIYKLISIHTRWKGEYGFVKSRQLRFVAPRYIMWWCLYEAGHSISSIAKWFQYHRKNVYHGIASVEENMGEGRYNEAVPYRKELLEIIKQSYLRQKYPILD